MRSTAAARESRLVVYGAMAANLLVGGTKLLAAVITGSSAMLAEAIHSFVDTGNSALLALGEHRSSRPPTAQHPLGHARESYVWALVAGVLIFALGSGMTTYEGILHLQHAEPITNAAWNYVVLGAALMFDGASWALAYRSLAKLRSHHGLFAAIRASKDPSRFAVFVEDSAALIGVCIALLGVLANHVFGQLWADGVASILIGLVLGAVAVFLVLQCRDLLLGESADAETRARIEQLMRGDADVAAIEPPLAIHLGPHDIVAIVGVEFRGALRTDEIERASLRLESAVRADVPTVQQLFVIPRRVGGGGTPRLQPRAE